jgi:C_GCAxxG_C_C family probable redox protein
MYCLQGEKMNRSDLAFKNVSESRTNCCQAVLTTFCEELGMERELALKTALAFGGGMGGTGRTCGVVTGAYMVIGLKQKTGSDAGPDREKIDNLVKDFNARFTAIHGSTNCKDLLGVDVGQPGGGAVAKEKGLFDSVCPRLAADSVKIIEKILEM